MRIFLFYLVAFFSVTCFAHTKKDSLHIEEIRMEAILKARKGDLIGCIRKIEFAIAEAESAELPDKFINARLKILLANRYSNMGDFHRSIEIMKSLEHFYKGINNKRGIVYTLNNLGVYHLNLGKYSTAYQYFKNGWQVQKESNHLADELDILDGLAAASIKLGNFDEAEHYMEKTERLLDTSTIESKDEFLLYHFANKSHHAIETKDDAKAEPYLLEYISISEKLIRRKGADAYLLLAELYQRKGKKKLALFYAKKIETLLGVENDPTVKDPYLFQCYALQAKILLDSGNYQGAINYCKMAEEQARFLQHQYLFNESKLILGKHRRKNLESGIMALYNLYKNSNDANYLKQAVTYADQAKSNVLNERWANLKMLSLTDQQEAVKMRYVLIFQLNELRNTEDKSQLVLMRNQLDSLNNVLGVKKEKTFSEENLNAVQQTMNKDEIYLQYLIIDSTLFRFDIQKNKISLDVQPLENPNLFLTFHHVLQNPNSTPQEYVAIWNQLPNLLPSYSLHDSIQYIRIIRDGVLNNMIFDAIPINSANSDWRDIHYAVQDYNFSYEFSIQSSKQHESVVTESNYIGFLPDYSQSTKWAQLQNSKKVIEEAEKYFEGKSYYGIHATKSNLYAQSSNADILHFYTHGVADDSNYNSSFIVLQDEEMYVDEILALPLQTSLSILTACEVGLGKQYVGEGITGIAWAFKAAGSENVIQSMWKLNEHSSYELMTHFFENLSNGVNSSKALTKAKRQYLSNTEISDKFKHPYYWVGIGHYGNGVILSGNTTNWWIIILSVILMVVVSLILMKYYRKREKKLM